MARSKKQSATAAEHNAETAEVRQEMFDNQANVVDMLTPAERWRQRQATIIGLAERIDANLDAIGLLRDEAKSIRLDAKAQDVDWKALTQMVALRRKAESKREAAERSRREVARAFGWDDGLQGDLFDAPAEGLIPGQQREYLGPTEAERDPAVAAALEAGFLTEEELSANGMDANGNVFEQDDGDDDESFDTLLEQAGVATVHADD